MYNNDTDFLFPPYLISSLMGIRNEVSPSGRLWDELVDNIGAAENESVEMAAFVLMMSRLNNCATCDTDTYRALHGCAACARQNITRFHGTDEELCALFQAARQEVANFISKTDR